jgi:hypothetical protein
LTGHRGGNLVEEMPSQRLRGRVQSAQLIDLVEVAVVQTAGDFAHRRLQPADVAKRSVVSQRGAFGGDVDAVRMTMQPSRLAEVAAQAVRRLEAGADAYLVQRSSS